MTGQRKALPTPGGGRPNLPLLGGRQEYGAWTNEKQGKDTTLLVRRVGHNCPQCGQFQAFQRAFLSAKNLGRNALMGTSLTVPRNLR